MLVKKGHRSLFILTFQLPNLVDTVPADVQLPTSAGPAPCTMLTTFFFLIFSWCIKYFEYDTIRWSDGMIQNRSRDLPKYNSIAIVKLEYDNQIVLLQHMANICHGDKFHIKKPDVEDFVYSANNDRWNSLAVAVDMHPRNYNKELAFT